MTRVKSELKFGDWVRYGAKYLRVRRMPRSPDWEKWAVWTVVDLPRERVDSGIFLGWRSLKNGVVDYDHDIGYTFTEKERVRAALVCPGPRNKTVYVPEDQILKGLGNEDK